MKLFFKNSILISFVFCFLLTACLPETEGQSSSEVKDSEQVEFSEHLVAGKKLCVPKNYIASSDDPRDPTIVIQTMYPDFLPLEKKPKEYWKEGEWWRQVKFLVSKIKSNVSYDDLAKQFLSRVYNEEYMNPEGPQRLIYPEEPKGTQYGLDFYPADPKDFGDYYLETSEVGVVSIIRCTAKHSETSVPQCSSRFNKDPFFISMHFNKKLLPHWEEIKRKSIALIEGFNCVHSTESKR